ncbi:uncharacterized protein PG986_014910 [Apiospora aurea]|uniref:Uncharacterized protein n=1 Tax=Apiospora aurea TaxID=335848 RepID=A0ABR1PUB1_9PEZI
MSVFACFASQGRKDRQAQAHAAPHTASARAEVTPADHRIILGVERERTGHWTHSYGRNKSGAEWHGGMAAWIPGSSLPKSPCSTANGKGEEEKDAVEGDDEFCDVCFPNVTGKAGRPVSSLAGSGWSCCWNGT